MCKRYLQKQIVAPEQSCRPSPTARKCDSDARIQALPKPNFSIRVRNLAINIIHSAIRRYPRSGMSMHCAAKIVLAAAQGQDRGRKLLKLAPMFVNFDGISRELIFSRTACLLAV
ncbi:MAG TPA: hypothetical protein DDW52_09870 [Planctomycetaceae bacterium]|nr:hypothetical protein [Planctomycetaceae bacterium]